MPFNKHPFKPKRIALFSGNYNYVMDGPVRALNKLVAFLENEGIEVLVFAPTAKKAAFEHSGTLISVPSIALPGRGEYRVAYGLPAKQKRQLEAFKPDLIHLSSPDLLGWAAVRWAKKHNVPAVASFHTRFDTYPRYYHMAWLEKYVTNYMRRFYHNCEQIYAPSECMVDVLRGQNMAKDIRIWSRGVDTTVFNPSKRDMEWRRSLGIEDNEVALAFVGRLVLEKGLDVFANTLDRLTKLGIKHKAIIVGEGPERDRFSSRLPKAVFTGYLKGEDLARAYASADIFFNASITETFGNVTLEAMACGIPSVCANATGSRSLVDCGETGFLVGPGNINEFTDQIARLVKNKALRQELAAAALKKGKKFSWHAILNQLLNQYGEVLETMDAAKALTQPVANLPEQHAVR